MNAQLASRKLSVQGSKKSDRSKSMLTKRTNNSYTSDHLNRYEDLLQEEKKMSRTSDLQERTGKKTYSHSENAMTNAKDCNIMETTKVVQYNKHNTEPASPISLEYGEYGRVIEAQEDIIKQRNHPEYNRSSAISCLTSWDDGTVCSDRHTNRAPHLIRNTTLGHTLSLMNGPSQNERSEKLKKDLEYRSLLKEQIEENRQKKTS